MERIQGRLNNGSLPGEAAQLTMAHPLRGSLPEARPDTRRAAVLALFYPNSDGELQLIFILRASHDRRDRHAGQIAFPGGSVEPQDTSLAATALRETEEEIGVPTTAPTLLGSMTELYIPVSNFLVTLFVGFVEKEPAFRIQTSEVAELIQVPFHEFFRPDVRQATDMKLPSGMKLKDVPYWDVTGRRIWGATSMMLAELIALARPESSPP